MKKLLTFLLALTCFNTRMSAQMLADYQAAVQNQAPATWFKLDGDLVSAVDANVVLTVFGLGSGFAFDVFGNNGRSYSFGGQTDTLYNQTTDLINGGGTSNTASTAAGSVTFLFRTLDPSPNTGQRYLFSAGDSAASANAFAVFLESTNVANGDPNSLKLRFGDSTKTILPAEEILPNTWYYLAVTYLESRFPDKAHWYVGRPGGSLASGTTTNSPEAVAGNDVGLYVGNRGDFNTAFRNPGNGQIDEFAIWNRELSAAEIQAQFARLPNRTPPPRSVYQSAITGQNPMHYFRLDGSLENAGGAPTLNVNGTGSGFTYDYFGSPTNARFFNLSSDALVVNSNLLNGGGPYTGTLGTGQGSLSCLFTMLSGTNNSGQRFVFSAGGATGVTNAFGLFVENYTSGNPAQFGSLKIRFGQSSMILPASEIVPSEWHYFAMTYDESQPTGQVHWWLGLPGSTLRTGTVNAEFGARAGQGDIFVIGNQNNLNARWASPGNGRVDEFAIWHRLLSESEVQAQFATLGTTLPSTLVPTLTIARLGGDVVLSWPVENNAGFHLESTATLSPPAWITNTSTVTVIGANNVVTNGTSTAQQYFRLKQ